MNRSRILLFSCEPGGAEALTPVVRLLAATPHYSVILTGYGEGLKRFSLRGLPVTQIQPIRIEPKNLVTLYQPDLVITSATSLPERDMSEKNLWINARTAGVPSIAFLDQWQNYAVRFSGVTPEERLRYLPDVINCIDELGQTEMLQEGFPKDRLYPLGHPYLASLKEEASRIDREEIARKFGPTAQKIHLFVSEAIKEYYGQQRGYDQYDALKIVLEYLEKTDPKSRLLIKLHPKDQLDSYTQLLEGSGLDVRIVRNELTPMECIILADKVYGMSSIMLIEALILGRPVVSIQPNLQGVDPFVLTRMGVIPRIDCLENLSHLAAQNSHTNWNVFFNEKDFLSLTEKVIHAKNAS